MAKRAWVLPFVVGLLATAALVGLLLLLSRVSPLSFVPLDIADAIIHLTPGAIATQGIETLGPGAKLLIELSGSVIFVAVGGLVAVLYARLAPRPLVSAGLALALIPLALTALVQLLTGGLRGGPAGLLLTAAAYLLWGFAVAWIVNRLVATAPQGVDDARRTFLFASSGGLLAVAVGSTAIAQLLARNGGDGVAAAGAGQALPTSAPPAPTTPASPTVSAAPTTDTAPQQAITAEPAATAVVPAASPTLAPTAQPTPVPFVPAPGTRSPFNTNETLYVISSATRDPVVDKDAWRLEIGGAVERPFSLRYAELLALPRVDQTSTMECISNEVGNYLIGNVKWNGVALKDLLERAGVQDGVVDIKLTAAEGYTESIPLAKAMEPTTLVAYGIDGEALAVKHGFPARLRAPGLYGEKNVKWLTRVEAVREDYKGYWQQRGWTDTAVVETTSVFDTANPFLGAAPPLKRENGVVPLGGIAFAGDRGIRAVEVRIGDGAWQPAQLDPVDDPLTWRFWRYDWRVDPGSYTLSVRAVDGAGAPQVAAERPPHPDGATGLMRITVTVE
jgi:DMSO/TMAO reductase YedYZ molybdopterin-dependent catalytic subunit